MRFQLSLRSISILWRRIPVIIGLGRETAFTGEMNVPRGLIHSVQNIYYWGWAIPATREIVTCVTTHVTHLIWCYFDFRASTSD